MRFLDVPIGLDADRWMTRPVEKRVLVLAHTMVCAQRLLDVMDVIAGDPRVQVLFTQPPDIFGQGLDRFLRELGAVVVPWEQARRTEFDLALSAGTNALADVKAPLVLTQHGAGFNKRSLRRRWGGSAVPRDTAGLDTPGLVHEGRVLPRVLVLSHVAQRRRLVESGSPLRDVAVVAGDPCWDRLRISVPQREEYRRAAGVDDRRLVVLASTWHSSSLYGSRPELITRAARELADDGTTVVLLLHPNVWAAHGELQVRTWLAEAVGEGLRIVPPEMDWRAFVICADWIIGDHGSATVYGAAVGVPVTLAAFPDDDIDPASPAAYLAANAPRLSDQPLPAQFREMAADPAHRTARALAARISSEPGAFTANLRPVLYRLMELDPPADPRAPYPAPVPHVSGRGW